MYNYPIFYFNYTMGTSHKSTFFQKENSEECCYEFRTSAGAKTGRKCDTGNYGRYEKNGG